MPKRKTAVLTDSACDMPPELAENNGVDILNFEIMVDGKRYYEREDFTFDEYYDILRNCEGIPSTAQVTMPRFLQQFEQYDQQGIRQVLYVSINASGSGTNDAAQLAAKTFHKNHPDSNMKIWVVDSRTYSMAYGWFVSEAAFKLHNGAEMQDVVEWLEDRFARMDIVLAAYSLKFMKKSGRISAAAAFAGELLGLRPIISLTDGVSTVRKKVRGDKEVLPALMEYAEQRMDDTTEYMVGGTDEAIIAQLAERCTKRWKAAPKATFKLGAAVATNTGPDAIAITFIGEKRG